MAITAAKRHSLPKSKFADPEHEKYPVDTPGRARAALSYGARYASPEVEANIHRLVKQNFPSIRQSHSHGGSVARRRYGHLIDEK